ncbi:AAC(3)-I family aminoglycoside N-acetyltransferase [Sphingomonas sabuli]|uniref:AAC(3)-I family aminoglycoside N-acetyltransferase n=1 Tax=Sphingomonas sabuli TaxID=2764186 RepID=A0A7G9L1Q6_9SPHN|nr:AAC(3)-I family aminoglycoside N-acetyltransferase [Sphingomonas sabuli]QNM82555.1 AAC(3)-I family aminoglycoside N-acetyltransferase [Sphingomonas sabuli]
MSGVKVRRLVPADIRVMQDMSRMFAAAFDEPETYARPPRAAYLDRLLGNPGFVALAALHDGEVVGGLIAYELVKYERERSEFYIYDLAVAEEHRRRGIATALIAEVCRIAAANDAEVVFVQADHGDDAAIALYTKLGTREDVMHFDIPAR